ncbi:hypothetical protein NECAME_16560 [Necator americanus]|uniref:STAC3-related SH3 domain-containing protein n=1 Tax=Necator americanus TaxID=51031 RepID=W2TY20_NECAM|nr:hypothetical protein NECAME_16560 [Necator americanus]ETN85946.1 hypothetical protein NECAME_16560 [Necator americanus]
MIPVVTDAPVDPVYLALKQATGKYGGRRGSSANNFDSATPSPRNLSQVSLQDYLQRDDNQLHQSVMVRSVFSSVCLQNVFIIPMKFSFTSTMNFEIFIQNPGFCRQIHRPKTSAEVNNANEIPFAGLSRYAAENKLSESKSNEITSGSKLVGGHLRSKNGSSDLSDWDRSCSPCNMNSRRGSAAATLAGGYIVIHEYTPTNGAAPLVLGERVHVVDNGDPDWLHGFRAQDRTERLLSFPATCVALVQPGEQAMKILQNVVVFAQPDSLHDGKVTVRTAHNAFAPCPLSSLALV